MTNIFITTGDEKYKKYTQKMHSFTIFKAK